MPLNSYEFEDSDGKLLLEDYDGKPWVLAQDVYTYIGTRTARAMSGAMSPART